MLVDLVTQVCGVGMINKSILVDILSIDLCRKYKDVIFVFGDNLAGYGRKGQAIIRNEYNSFGVPTKRLPSMATGSFFTDAPSEIEAVKVKLDELKTLKDEGRIIAFPSAGLGTGLAMMGRYSPSCLRYMNDRIYNEFLK